MILELKTRLLVQVPADALGGAATRESLTRLAEEKVSEKLKVMFAGWPNDLVVTATLDGQSFTTLPEARP